MSGPTSEQAMDEIYDRLQSSFSRRTTYPVHYRLFQLKQLAYMIKDNEARIHAAVKADLDQGEFAVSMGDLYAVYNEVDLAVKRLPTWVKDETRIRDSLLSFKFMSPRIKTQPKGVALIISPWNFPWQLTMVPLVNAIAAGCPAIIKPAEHSPHSSALMAELLPSYLDPEAYAVVLGAVDETTHLLRKPWGHIMYTGSDRVGKIVAKAAADTLTPTTLELGGKSPVVVSECADLPKITKRLFSIKQLTIGQMCVTPDYVLVQKERADAFVAESIKTLDTFFPRAPHSQSLLHAPMSACLRSQAEFDRQVRFLDEAKGKVVYRGEADRNTKRMGFSLVLMAEDAIGEAGGLLDEEIFGPVLPIIPVSSIDKAIQIINSKPHPLALYVCSNKKAVFDKVIGETISGSATWNDFAFATLARSLPFGGVGGSGWGAYHGYDGFKTFSHFKSTLQVPMLFEPLMALRYPPTSSFGRWMLTFLLCTGTNFSRPTSLEDEKRRYWWRKNRKWLLAWVVVFGTGLAAVAGDYVGKQR